MRKRLLTIIAFVLGIVIFGGATGVVAYGMGANQVGFTPKDSAWKVNSVNEAIDDLYIKKTGDNYSTEERVVGTWIDGRPVYQKTIDVNNIKLSSSTNTTINTGVGDMDLLIDAKARLTTTESGYNNYILSINAYGSANSMIVVACNGSWDAKSYRVWTFTIQYTKTTDTVPSENNQG